MDSTSPDSHPICLLRLRDVMDRVGLRSSAIYQSMQRGTFPKPIRLGESVSVAWLDQEVDAWLMARLMSRQPNPTPRKRRLKGSHAGGQVND
ncbi:Prophage CP4-57 regulatory protein (AlpA) [compost metagenome]